MDNLPVPAVGVQLLLPGRVTATSWEPPASLTYEQWLHIGKQLLCVSRSVQWWIGDWLRAGAKWGEKYEQAIRETGRSYDGLRLIKSIAERFQFDRRRSNLSFGHHAEVGYYDDADDVLDLAEQYRWSQRETRAEVSRRRAVESPTNLAFMPAHADAHVTDNLAKLVAAGERFGTIYADPPWLYDNQGTRSATRNHYLGLTVEELCGDDYTNQIRALSADAAHLHLWTTNAFLFECPKIFAAWGFEFRTTFVWCKEQMGIGNYWRNSHEIMLTAVRGDAKHFNDHSMMSWMEGGGSMKSDRTRHSAKPAQVRQLIERASPRPYLELFGRTSVDGWTVFGNDPNLFHPNLLEHHKEVA